MLGKSLTKMGKTSGQEFHQLWSTRYVRHIKINAKFKPTTGQICRQRVTGEPRATGDLYSTYSSPYIANSVRT